jgi:hypothetical protein
MLPLAMMQSVGVWVCVKGLLVPYNLEFTRAPDVAATGSRIQSFARKLCIDSIKMLFDQVDG